MLKSNKIKLLQHGNTLDLRPGIKYSAKAGVLITLFIMQALFLPAQSNNLPLPKGYVSDYAGIINNSDKQIIEALGIELKQKSGAEIALLTVSTIEPYSSIDEYANEVMSKWGIGEKGKDNGVLIVLSTGEGMLRIEVGYGLEGAITDGHAGSIMDKYMIPYFRNKDFSTGLKEGYSAVAVAVAKEYNFEITGVSYRQYNNDDAGLSLYEIFGSLGFFVLFFIFGGRFFWLFFFLPSVGRMRRGFGKGFDGGSSGFGGGFSRGSGFGGGFSGFGGGFSGGGGASRRF
ncbi:MAG: TPM domain-containing protein [Spirochaetaceae bacterium]|nr:TPM domain-containing protein [Spirochaetaceae bacterium]